MWFLLIIRNNVIILKHYPHYRAFVNSTSGRWIPPQRATNANAYIFFVVSLSKLLNNQFVRECGLNLADTVMQRSMFHFGHSQHCYSGALLSGSGHCCPFRVRAPVDFLHGRTIIGCGDFVLCQGVLGWWPLTCLVVICNRCYFRKYPSECQEI